MTLMAASTASIYSGHTFLHLSSWPNPRWQPNFSLWSADVEHSSFPGSERRPAPISLVHAGGRIHWVSVLLCSSAYDLFICGVKLTTPSAPPPRNPRPVTPPPSSNTPIRNIEGGPYGDEAVKLLSKQLSLMLCRLCRFVEMDEKHGGGVIQPHNIYQAPGCVLFFSSMPPPFIIHRADYKSGWVCGHVRSGDGTKSVERHMWHFKGT